MFLTTVEMIFACHKCGAKRQYGTGLNLLDKPANTLPLIRCRFCKCPTYHVFVRCERRSDRREEQVANNMRTA